MKTSTLIQVGIELFNGVLAVGVGIWAILCGWQQQDVVMFLVGILFTVIGAGKIREYMRPELSAEPGKNKLFQTVSLPTCEHARIHVAWMVRSGRGPGVDFS